MKSILRLLGAFYMLPCMFSSATAETASPYQVQQQKWEIDARQKSEIQVKLISVGLRNNQMETLNISSESADFNKNVLAVIPGQQVRVCAESLAFPCRSSLYVDLDRNGIFSEDGKTSHINTSEILTSFENNEFSIPAGLQPGMYRARILLGDSPVAATSDRTEHGSHSFDFLLNVHDEEGELDLRTLHGSIVGADNSGVPEKVFFKEALELMPVPVAHGYEPGDVTVRHGHNLDGEQYVNGVRQWDEYTMACTDYIDIPAECVDGDVRVTLYFEQTDAAEYTLQFCDEFNQPDGSLPDPDKWVRCYSWGSTWDRTCAQTPEGQKMTAYIENGKLVTLCLKNPFDEEVLNGVRRDMISGGVESHSKYDFTYGKVEGRLVTHKHRGNFPAFWMMPSVAEHGAWPMDGEIDIFEQIDTEDISYHTIHSNWTLNMGQANNPPKGGTSWTPIGDYHVYTFEWTEDKLIWYTDGMQCFSYAKSKNPYALDNLQWPFYKDFYLILNQSVGNGSWAQPCDVNHVYRTDFDWVRVYQKGKSTNPETGIDEMLQNSELDVYGFVGNIRLVAVDPVVVKIADMQGRALFNQLVQGNVDVPVDRGLYIVNGRKVLVK